MVTEIFAGIRVLDVAQNTFGPAAAGVLADFGADVIKVEHPVRGDPQRGLVTAAIQPTVDGVNLGMAQVNRGKRSIGLDLTAPAGAEALAKLVAVSDVLLTNSLPATTRKLGVDEPTIRAANPKIIYARASGHGTRRAGWRPRVRRDGVLGTRRHRGVAGRAATRCPRRRSPPSVTAPAR